MRRFGLFYVVPGLLLLVLAILPLVTGTGTLVLRDVLTSHYPLKAAQAKALAAGELPLIDLYRGGGQPLLGNPNVLPLYPDNVLYLVAAPLWALNAHFWLHLLLAPVSFYWLGRAWGLERKAAWAAGMCYATSGFFLSLLNLYNLVSAAALAPAVIAAVLEAWEGPRRRFGPLALALVWALLLLAGDPFFALLTFLLAVAAGFARYRALPRRPLAAGLALVCGGALAAPMWVEFLRILPLSFRGYWRYSVDAALTQSWDPRAAVELFFPLFFGPPDFSFWGERYSGGLPPLLYSLYPGLLVWALILAARWKSRAGAWAWGAIGTGLFLALGSWNPVVRWLYHVPGVSALRFPVKMWLLAAVGGALLAGMGFERLQDGGGRRTVARVLAALAVGYFAVWLLVNFTGVGAGLEPERLVGPALEHQRLRWAGQCLLSLAALLALAAALRLGRRRRELAGALLVALHVAFQLFFLRPLYSYDESRPYLEEPEVLAEVGEGERIVHGGLQDLFGVQRLARDVPFPDFGTHHLTRLHFAQLYPVSGVVHGRRYELNHSPEGLDSFLTVALAQAMKRMDDVSRVRVLRASGVDVLLLDRPLEPAALAQVRERSRRPTPIGELYVYELRDRAAPVQLAVRVLPAPHMNAALDHLTDPSFDPRTMVVLRGEGEPRAAAPGRATLVRESAEVIEVDVECEGDGVLVVQRTYHGIFRAAVDGEPAEIRPANLHRMAVEVPAGTHRVRIWADRRPTRVAWAVAGLGLLGLALQWQRGARRPTRASRPGL